MTTHLPHWSKLSFHKKPTKLVTADASSPPPPVMHTPGGRRPARTIFTEDSPRTSARSGEEEDRSPGGEDEVADDDSEAEDEERRDKKGEDIESKTTCQGNGGGPWRGIIPLMTTASTCLDNLLVALFSLRGI